MTKPNWLSALAALIILVGLLIFPFLNPCQHEDSTACYWNAQEQGNQQGISYINYYGLMLFHP